MAKETKKSGILNPTEANVQYWDGLVTRDEFQKVMDEQDSAIALRLTEFEMILKFLLERLQIQPQEFGAWMKAKAAIISKPTEEQKVTLE